MIDRGLEELLHAWMRVDGPHDAPPEVVARALASARELPQGRWALPRLLRRHVAGAGTGRRSLLIATALLVALLLAASALVAGGLVLGPERTDSTDCPAGICPAGALVESRSSPTMTVLEDGRVLVVGGYDPATSRVRTSSELLDIRTGRSQRTGAPIRGRARHTATLLPDGRVLVIGGDDDQDKLLTAEVWEPSTGAFRRAGTMHEARSGHTATLLADGRVMVIGGEGEGDAAVLATTEIWDARTETFAPGPRLDRARDGHSATMLVDGSILVVGGHGIGGELAVTELLDPSGEEFEPTGRMVLPRLRHLAVRLLDGDVLVVGDEGTDGLAEVWGSGMGTFTPSAAPPRGLRLEDPRPILGRVLSDGRVLLMTATRGTILWDPVTREFSDSGVPDQAIHGDTATELGDGRVVVLVGAGEVADPAGTVYVYRPEDWLPSEQPASPEPPAAPAHDPTVSP